MESLVLFDSVVNSRWFMRTSIVLFLNKVDLFRQKLKKSPLVEYFPDYSGGEDVNRAAKYLLDSAERHAADEEGGGVRVAVVGDDREVLPRGDDPVPALRALEREVARRREQDRDAVELVAFQEVLHAAGDGLGRHAPSAVCGRTNTRSGSSFSRSHHPRTT